LNDISRAGDAIVRPLQDTSTAQRSAIPTLAGLALGGYNVGGPIGAGLAMTLPTAAGTLMNNPITQRYLRNQLLATAPRLPLGAVPGLLGTNQ
jgi:outer membrane lipoprotein SlyB